MAFESVSEATKIWIKGRDFTVPKLLGENYKDDWDRYSSGGALCIFRLAPQDYHRFHSPVDGKIGKMTYIAGEYYTVNVSVLPVLLSILFPCLFPCLHYGFSLMLPRFVESISGPQLTILSPAASSHPNCFGRLRRECQEDRSYRQPSIWQGYGRVRWRHDGRQHQDHRRRGSGGEARRRVWLLRVWYVVISFVSIYASDPSYQVVLLSSCSSRRTLSSGTRISSSMVERRWRRSSG